MVHDKKEEPQAVVTESADLSGRFIEIITYYRYLLSKQMMSARERTACRDIGRELYNLLFHTIEDQIADKKELLIIPGGILAFVPFETLIMPDGRYMAEEYTITYTQSLAVSELISKRNYPGDRKSLLAFGGAVYNEPTYDLALVESEQQLAAVEKNILLAMTRGEGAGETYYQLGYGDWDNLPGTLTEVRAIGQVVSGAEVITGHMVDEAGIKELSRTGRLDDYRVIHFATHGLAVPEIPELSAIVLSLSNKEENKPEDGYLRMQEIVELDLQADFVNLSACETGLGKLYGGEGVVGLTQAFLVAGANGLCVSLWQVADDSTMEFMTGLYRLVETKGLSYSDAMAEMKRQFIGGKYAAPFHWAPFVHYGQ